jgi:hypothetical protein
MSEEISKNLSILEYLDIAEDFNKYLNKFALSASCETINDKIIALQKIIKSMQSASKRIADICNLGSRIIQKRKKSVLYIDTYPSKYDHAVIRNENPENSINIVDDLKINALTVDKFTDIPMSNIYYNETYKQFAININGYILRGNIGNIKQYNDEQTALCKYGINCKNLINKKQCTYYHDPEDFIQLKIPIDKNYCRNYTNGNFIYSKKISDENFRHVSNKETLTRDILDVKKYNFTQEIKTRESQVMHDLLLYLIMTQNNLNDNYKKW